MDKYILDILLNDTDNGVKDVKQVVKNIFNNTFTISQHSHIINETDRNIASLLWHENAIDLLSVQTESDLKQSLQVYARILKNICFADCINRVTFQYQIWGFNELCSLIKTLYCNDICNTMTMDKKDMLLLFSTMQKNTDSTAYDVINKCGISPLNIKRVNKYINNFENCEEV